MGSDHYPIMIEVGLSLKQYQTGGLQKWSFSNADWDTFRNICDQEMEKNYINEEADHLNISICKAILEAARQSMKKKGGWNGRRIVPWWTKECSKAIKSRNKAFKLFKRNHNFQNRIEYNRLQANVEGKKVKENH